MTVARQGVGDESSPRRDQRSTAGRRTPPARRGRPRRVDRPSHRDRGRHEHDERLPRASAARTASSTSCTSTVSTDSSTRSNRSLETDDALDDLRQVALAYRGFATEHPMYYEIMFGQASPSSQSIDRALAGLGNFVARIERASERDSITLPGDLDSTAAVAWLWGTCHGLVSLELDGIASEVVDWASIFASAIDVALAGLRPASTHGISN
ncbi:MAG: TetR-like C-terminal domain-containing protein [Ilumatobacteraceae bacterium]